MTKITHEECGDYYNYFGYFAGAFCASPDDGGICSGDSGGFVGARNTQGRYVQYGVNSFGPAMCELHIPHGFTDVAAYMEWINSYISPSSEQPRPKGY